VKPSRLLDPFTLRQLADAYEGEARATLRYADRLRADAGDYSLARDVAAGQAQRAAECRRLVRSLRHLATRCERLRDAHARRAP